MRGEGRGGRAPNEENWWHEVGLFRGYFSYGCHVHWKWNLLHPAVRGSRCAVVALLEME